MGFINKRGFLHLSHVPRSSRTDQKYIKKTEAAIFSTQRVREGRVSMRKIGNVIHGKTFRVKKKNN